VLVDGRARAVGINNADGDDGAKLVLGHGTRREFGGCGIRREAQ
jgi:hypothetical protein